MAQLPTVRIVHEDGFRIINARDFDAAVHRLYDDTPAPAPPVVDPVKPAAPGPATEVDPVVPESAPVAQLAPMVVEAPRARRKK